MVKNTCQGPKNCHVGCFLSHDASSSTEGRACNFMKGGGGRKVYCLEHMLTMNRCRMQDAKYQCVDIRWHFYGLTSRMHWLIQDAIDIFYKLEMVGFKKVCNLINNIIYKKCYGMGIDNFPWTLEIWLDKTIWQKVLRHLQTDIWRSAAFWTNSHLSSLHTSPSPKRYSML